MLSVAVDDNAPHRIGQLAPVLVELARQLGYVLVLGGRTGLGLMLARLGLDQALYPLLELFDLFLVLLDRRGEPARLVAEFFRRSLVLRFVFAERCEFPVAALIHLVELAFLVLQVGDFASERCGRRVDPGGFLLAHAVVATHIGYPSRCVVEILGREQENEEAVQLVVFVGAVNHLAVFLAQTGQVLFERSDRRALLVDVPVEQTGLLLEVGYDVAAVADLVADQLQLLVGRLLVLARLGKQVVRYADFPLGPLDVFSQRFQRLAGGFPCEKGQQADDEQSSSGRHFIRSV